MLVLSRHKGETIMVGDDVKIVVVEIRSDKVRLGFEGPKGIAIHRKEVYDAIQKKQPKPVCTNCGDPFQPGHVACARCGAIR